MNDDLQKDRWGGKIEDAGLKIQANVKKTDSPKWFDITVEMSATGKRRFEGEVAFFLHDTFPEEIRYTKAANGIARIGLIAFEAFTAGAYTGNGISLELDLQRQEGYPKEFYYKEKMVKRAAKKKK